MTVTIGRASLADIFDVRLSGRRLTFTTDIEAASADEMKAIRQQLAGLVDNRDEEVIPFTWSDDPTLDGYYRVASVNVPSTEVMLTSGFIPDVEVELEQVGGLNTTWFETTVNAVTRTNSHGITTPSTLCVAWPYPVTGWNADINLPSALTSPVGYLQRGLTSTVDMFVSFYAAPVALTAYRYNVPAIYAGLGACTIEIKYGSSWYPVVGKNMPRTSTWRISNGLVRLTANGTSVGTFEVWDNAAQAWESRNVKHWANGAAYLNIGFNAPMTIIRNSPEQVTVAVSWGSESYSVVWYYSIQRGARLVAASWSGTTAERPGFGFDASHAAACTSITGGIRATANDANGNRLVFGTAGARSTDLVNGGTWYTSSATTGSAFIGAEAGGSGAAGLDLAAALVDQFLGAVSWKQNVVIR